jgi:hypothetical protein
MGALSLSLAPRLAPWPKVALAQRRSPALGWSWLCDDLK